MAQKMTWIATKLFFRRSWIWLKEHWQVPFLIFWSIVVWVMSRRNSDAIIEVLEAKKESYKRQIIELNRIHRSEILKRNNLLNEYERVVEKIEEEFSKREEELEEEQKETIKKIIIDSKGDPDAVKKEVENLFNFTFIE